MDRREFLKVTGMGGAALAAGGISIGLPKQSYAAKIYSFTGKNVCKEPVYAIPFYTVDNVCDAVHVCLCRRFLPGLS